MQFTYKNKEDGRVVKRDSVWDSAEASDEWERTDNSVSADSEEQVPAPDAPTPNGRPRVDQSDVDPEELAGGAPAEDLPGEVPGEVPYLSQMTTAQLEEYAVAAGIEGAHLFESREALVNAIQAQESTEPAESAGDDEAEADAGGDDGSEDSSSDEELDKLSRAELNAVAATEGVEDADKLPNIAAVISAIREKREG